MNANGMNLDEIKKTDIWQLFEHGRNYMRLMNVFSDTDLNYRMTYGNQWEGAKIEGIEQAQYNIIETIVNYKTSTINQNLYAMHFSSENYEEKEFRKTAEKTCELLDRKAGKVWDKEQMDTKIRAISDDSAINDEGVMYVWYDADAQSPVNEIINKNDIQYGNEQSSDIQSQPYIVISQRKSVIEITEIARREGASEEDIKYIIGDTDTQEQAGIDSKLEKDDMCTLVTKMWKENGTVWYASATKYVDIKKPTDTKLTLYPVAHFVWKEKKGWSRGEGEVRTLIPNQLELNKTLARMLLSIKQCAYTQKIANVEKIINPQALDQIGGVIKVRGGSTVDDVSKIFTYVQPATMSTDVSKLLQDLITITRDLRNASEFATGGVNPEETSGRAILAVQQASKQPLTKQSEGLKRFIEDIARIWLDMWTVYTPEGMTLEEEMTDSSTGETYIQLVEVPATVLESLKANVKVDVTPTSPFDKYATELTLENFLKAGYFNAQRVKELRYYAESLPDNASSPKLKLLDICEKIEEDQQKIAMIDAQAKMMQQRASQFLMEDPTAQASQMIEAGAGMPVEQMPEM